VSANTEVLVSANGAETCSFCMINSGFAASCHHHHDHDDHHDDEHHDDA
jgi:hypothetical protein